MPLPFIAASAGFITRMAVGTTARVMFRQAVRTLAKDLATVDIKSPAISFKAGGKWYGDAVKAQVQYKAFLAMEKACKIVEADAKRIAPYRFGGLKNSIHSRYTKTQGFVIADIGYANFVEYGTSKMSARPYLRPALRKNRVKINRLFRNLL